MDDALTPVAASALLRMDQPAWDRPVDVGNLGAYLHDLPLLHDRDPSSGWIHWIDRHGPSD
ncbi:MAG: hypothetical protein WBA25_08335, partial [Jannaschia sp.]